MTEMISASFNEVQAFGIAFQVLHFIADKWIALSKQRKALDECQIARSRYEAQRQVLAYVLVGIFATLLIGSMFYTISARSRC